MCKIAKPQCVELEMNFTSRAARICWAPYISQYRTSHEKQLAEVKYFSATSSQDFWISLCEVVPYRGDLSYSDAKIQAAWRGAEKALTLRAACLVCFRGWDFLQKADPVLPFEFRRSWTQPWKSKYHQHLLICKKHHCLLSKDKTVNWNLYFLDYKQYASFLLNSLQNVQMTI